MRGQFISDPHWKLKMDLKIGVGELFGMGLFAQLMAALNQWHR